MLQGEHRDEEERAGKSSGDDGDAEVVGGTGRADKPRQRQGGIDTP